MGRGQSHLLEGLESLRARYESAQALALDPIAIPLRYPAPWDRELAAWVAAHLAYGRVAPMLRAIDAALAPLGEHPAAWVRQKDEAFLLESLGGALQGWCWRFHTASDLVHWILAWKRLDSEPGGLEARFLPAPGEDADWALSRLVQRLRRELPLSRGLRFCLPDPMEGAACKRWRMFLRWMARSDWPDLGLWTHYPKEQLVIPLDTHVGRIGRYLGLTRRATDDAKAAREITDALRRLDASDPLKYDFALAHLGIMGDCPGIRSLPGCAPCPLVDVCRAGH